MQVGDRIIGCHLFASSTVGHRYEGEGAMAAIIQTRYQCGKPSGIISRASEPFICCQLVHSLASRLRLSPPDSRFCITSRIEVMNVRLRCSVRISDERGEEDRRWLFLYKRIAVQASGRDGFDDMLSTKSVIQPLSCSGWISRLDYRTPITRQRLHQTASNRYISPVLSHLELCGFRARSAGPDWKHTFGHDVPDLSASSFNVTGGITYWN
ncbi:hypothetical protein EV421DRAFT_1740346 [Armillaria borealis]|uniref:Uncharacterized protein n=1 Tax=Armillaria borealis TaxID=47425 RepID=A0AA39J380_9AGAR|nr:hypothetical protein EV421DRAFT_1740346 [Armillaria borealis]